MQLRLTSNYVSQRDLIRYDSGSGWGYYFSGIRGDSVPEREIYPVTRGDGVSNIALPHVKPREWEIHLTAWGRSYALLQRARGEIVSMFAPFSYAQSDPPLLIEARADSTRPWASIRAFCIGMDWDEDEQEGIFTARGTIRLVSPFPYWRADNVQITLSVPSVVSTNGFAVLRLDTNALVTSTQTAASNTRVTLFGDGINVAIGRSDNVIQFASSLNGVVWATHTLPSGSFCNGLITLPNTQLIAGTGGASFGTYLWTGTVWAQQIATDGAVLNLKPARDGNNRYAVCGTFTTPRRNLFIVDAGNHGAIMSSYADVFGDLTFSTGQFACLDAFVFGSTIVAVGRNQNVSPHLRLVRIGNEAGVTDIASWNHMIGGFGNAPIRIDGFTLHDLLITGTMTAMNVGITGITSRAVRLRNLGGIEIAGDVLWHTSFSETNNILVKRIGSRIFAHTSGDSPDRWLLMWTGGGWSPVLWANGNINDIAGDDSRVLVVGTFTQVQAYTQLSVTSPALFVDPTIALPSGARYYGTVWSDGNGSLCVDVAGTTTIPSHCFVTPEARLGTNYYGLAPGAFRPITSASQPLMMIRGTSGNLNYTVAGYYEDWRQV